MPQGIVQISLAVDDEVTLFREEHIGAEILPLLQKGKEIERRVEHTQPLIISPGADEGDSVITESVPHIVVKAVVTASVVGEHNSMMLPLVLDAGINTLSYIRHDRFSRKPHAE